MGCQGQEPLLGKVGTTTSSVFRSVPSHNSSLGTHLLGQEGQERTHPNFFPTLAHK
jgi:hypothetical protein